MFISNLIVHFVFLLVLAEIVVSLCIFQTQILNIVYRKLAINCIALALWQTLLIIKWFPYYIFILKKWFKNSFHVKNKTGKCNAICKIYPIFIFTVWRTHSHMNEFSKMVLFTKYTTNIRFLKVFKVKTLKIRFFTKLNIEYIIVKLIYKFSSNRYYKKICVINLNFMNEFRKHLLITV